jgi:hypothetical protein
MASYRLVCIAGNVALISWIIDFQKVIIANLFREVPASLERKI